MAESMASMPRSVGDIKIVMGAATYGHCSGVFRSANAGDRAALEDLMQRDRLASKLASHVPGSREPISRTP